MGYGKDARELFERSIRFRRDVVKRSRLACKELAPQAGVIIGDLTLEGGQRSQFLKKGTQKRGVA